MFRLMVILLFVSLPVYGSDSAITHVDYSANKAIYTGTSAGLFVLRISDNEGVIYRFSAKVSRLKGLGEFKVVTIEDESQIGKGSCRLVEDLRFGEYYLDRGLDCQMIYTDQEGNTVELNKLLSYGNKTLLSTEGFLINPAGEILIKWKDLHTDDLSNYLIDCYGDRGWSPCE